VRGPQRRRTAAHDAATPPVYSLRSFVGFPP